ncbi:hypothetical protein SeLEV6574_g00532 [Synchytrium endobioticum]|uniref:Secreted protein n=1 Tax=Synchytrium endobioticum TaxID=286115 RepID=A0A507DH72_9FUNG|nr:hypothetical protein SeLEV6574_g00532 [Synchytrium endobioticum]
MMRTAITIFITLSISTVPTYSQYYYEPRSARQSQQVQMMPEQGVTAPPGSGLVWVRRAYVPGPWFGRSTAAGENTTATPGVAGTEIQPVAGVTGVGVRPEPDGPPPYSKGGSVV